MYASNDRNHDTTHPLPTVRPLPRWVAAELRTLASRAETLAAFLLDNHNRGEAVAARNIASAIRRLAQ